MREVRFDKKVNPELLDIELRRVLGDDYVGLSTADGYPVVYLRGEPDGVTSELLDDVVAAHNPNLLSPRQRAELRRRSIRSRLGGKTFAAMSESEREEALQVLLEVNGLALPPESEG